jgi:hypothetical protein
MLRMPVRSRPLTRALAARDLSCRPVLMLNLCVLAAAVALGVWAYGGLLEGKGDDLRNLNPAAHPTEWHYLKMLYTTWGQVGFGGLMVPWRLVVRIFGIGPDVFPWWFFAGLNAGLNVLAVVHFVIAGKVLMRHGRSWALGLCTFTAALWILNPVSFATTVGIPVVFFSAYTLPLYLVSLFSLGFATAGSPLPRSRLIQLVAVYLLVSLNEATFMLSLPVLVLALTVVKAHRGARPLADFIRMILPWTAASAAAAFFVWTTPGFHYRAPLLGFAVPSGTSVWAAVPGWYGDSVRMIYGALFLDRIAYPVVLHSGLLSALCAGLLMTFLRTWWRRESRRDAGVLRLLDANVLALGYLLAAHAAMSTMLFTPYFPEYTKAYPALLVALGIGSSMVWAIRVIGTLAVTGAGTERAAVPFAVAAAFVVVSASVWLGLQSSARVVDAYRQELRTSRTLGQARHQARAVYQDTGQRNYNLSHCPPRLEAYDGATLTPDYFTWQGLPALSVIQEGAGNSSALPQSSDAHRIQCEAPVLIPWNWGGVASASASPVRVTSYVAADGTGVEQHDFFVPETAKSCTASGSYNPNASASALYRNAFKSELLFSTSYSYAVSPPGVARSMVVLPQGHAKGIVNPAITISVGYVAPDGQLTSELPLDAFRKGAGEPPVVRVSLEGLHASWLTLHTSVRFECQ